jgi:hypothetical protein
MDTSYINLTEDGGVQKKIELEGAGEHPESGNLCKVITLRYVRCTIRVS